jgi:hypothetical protein
MVVVADGAPWIWNIAQELLPGAIQIVDRFHVKQALHRTAQSIFGSTGDQTKQWASARCVELDDGKCTPLFVRSVPMPPTPPMPLAADSTFIAIATACGIHGSTNTASVPRPASSKPDAKSLSELASSALECIGRWTAPTTSSPYGAVASAGGLRISGNDEMGVSQPDDQFCAVHPWTMY